MSSESRHELIAIDTKRKLAIIAKNFILIYKQLYRQVLYKIIDNMAVFLDKNALE